MATACIDDLFPKVRNPEGTRIINHRCLLRIQGERCLVIVSGVVIAQYQFGDSMAEAYAMVTLVEQGWADQIDVARGFGRSARTVRRYQQRFEAGGLAALSQPRGYPKGRQRLAASRTELIQRRKAKGDSNREIARRLGVSEMAIRKLLRRTGWKEELSQPGLFPTTEVSCGDRKLPVSSNPAWICPHRSYRQVRTQNCPLWVSRPHHSLQAATTRTQAIALPIDCWPAWACWKMPLHCLVAPPPCLAPECSWPCRSWSPAACSSVRKKSTATWAQPFMACAPVC